MINIPRSALHKAPYIWKFIFPHQFPPIHFSINCHILDFISKVATFLLDIQAKIKFSVSFLAYFQIFQCLPLAWVQSSIPDNSGTSTPYLNKYFMLCFLHSGKQHTKSFNGISMKENFYLPTSDPFHSFWLNGILKTQNFKWTHWFDAIHQYTSGIEKLACRINTKFNYVINVYSNCIPGELWDLIKTEFWEEICLKVECFHFFFPELKAQFLLDA